MKLLILTGVASSWKGIVCILKIENSTSSILMISETKFCNKMSFCKLVKVDVYTKAISKKVFHDQCDQDSFTHVEKFI